MDELVVANVLAASRPASDDEAQRLNMHRPIRLGIIIVGCMALWMHGGDPSRSEAQSLPTDPMQLPLLQGGDLRYLGRFNAPDRDGTGRSEERDSLIWGGFAIGTGPDGKSLYFGCHDWHSQLARITIPDMDGTAEILQPCAAIPNLQAINPGDPNKKVLGGSMAWKGKVVVSAYSYYDGGGTARASHFVSGPDLASFQGPFRVGKENPGMIGGYMGVVPAAWQALIGGAGADRPVLHRRRRPHQLRPVNQRLQSRHARAGQLGPGQAARRLSRNHQALGPWDQTSQTFNGSTKIGGVAFPPGTRSVLFVGRHGTTFCYGTGTSVASQHGRPDGQGNNFCFDPTDGSKGGHGFPYRHQIWAYDAKDLADVNAGRKDPWNLKPYSVWTLTEMDGGQGTANITSATFDPATQRLYVATGGTRVHVYEVSRGAGPSVPVPPPPDEVPLPPPPPPSDSPQPPAEICGDGLDNDGDGLVDEDCGNAGPDTSGWTAPQALSGSGVSPATMAACGASVHVAHGNGAVYYRRSTSEGADWNDWQQLGDGAIPSRRGLACDGATVVLTAQRGLREVRDWQGPQQVGDLWTWVSDDAGATWREPVKLSSGAASGAAATAIADRRVVTAWMQFRGQSPGTWDVHYRESGDGGHTWSDDTTLAAGGTAAGAAWPTVAMAGGTTLVAWTDTRSTDTGCARVAAAGGCAAVTVRRLTSGGWSSDDRIVGA